MHRYVLEGFFQDVLMQVRDSQLLLDLIGATTFPKNKLTNLTNCSHPTMLFVNELLLIREVREAIWQGMGIKAVVEVPRFPTYLIYGLVSLNLVYPPADAVYISDLMDPKLADFLKFLAERSRLPVDVYDEMAASAGEDLVADLRNPVAISELSDVASLSIPDGSQKDSKSANV